MTYRITQNKWILYRHTSNFDIITAVAANLKTYSACSISKEEKLKLLKKLKTLNYYKERNPELPLDSINHRINTLAYYMFGYKVKEKGKSRFLFSPLGNLFLKHIGDQEKLSKIFLTMLWSLQFNHPHGGTDETFKLYPFRLVFKLLTEKRLNYELRVPEFAAIVMFTDSIDDKKYEMLVKEILNFRENDKQEIISFFKKHEHVLVNAVYEWDYYVSKLFERIGILEKIKGHKICKLQHGESTTRTLKDNKVKISSELLPYCKALLNQYPFTDKPLALDNDKELLQDVTRKIYSFYPSVLMDEIGDENQEFNSQLLKLPKLIEQYSKNENNTQASLFEDILEEGFNMFIDVEANKISGPGNTDIECLYLVEKKKFAVEAKSTQNKLSSINAGRLKRHRKKINGAYTIVVTPKYVPAVKYDILDQPIALITASAFSEYLYNHIINDAREIPFGEFDNVIESNLGKDISSYISDLTMNKFAVTSS